MTNADIDIIILKGAPASGKSQTAKCLAAFYPNGVRLEVDNLRNMVISPNWKNQSEHINLLTLSSKVALEFLALGFKPIIVVDTFSGDKLLNYLNVLKQVHPELNIKILALLVDAHELTTRVQHRESWEFKDLDICLRLNEDVRKLKLENEFQVNTTGRQAKETAEIIFKYLND